MPGVEKTLVGEVSNGGGEIQRLGVEKALVMARKSLTLRREIQCPDREGVGHSRRISALRGEINDLLQR